MDPVGDPIVEAPSEPPDELGPKKDHGPSRGLNIGGPERTSGRIGPKKDHGPKRGPNIGGAERIEQSALSSGRFSLTHSFHNRTQRRTKRKNSEQV